MPAEYDPSQERFDSRDCAGPLRQAVADLARDAGLDPEAMEGKSLAEIGRLAEETYDTLPDFWRVWKDWHTPQPPPQMGDL